MTSPLQLPLLNQGYTLFLDNYYASPELAQKLRESGTDMVGTCRKNRKYFPKELINVNQEKGEFQAMNSDNGIMAVNFRDKKSVLLLSTIHGPTRSTYNSKGKTVSKPTCVVDYNSFMGGVDLKDQKLAPYLIARKKCIKWYVKLFKNLLNAAIHNALICYNSLNSKPYHHLSFRIDLVRFIFQKYHPLVPREITGRPMVHPNPLRLTAGKNAHFMDKIPAEGKKASAQRKCVVCKKKGKRKESCYWCPDCEAALCIVPCFKLYHTVENF